MAYKYYWLKLMQDFYEQTEIKKLRTMPAGDTLVIIYQRMQLMSLRNNGVIKFEGYEEDLAAELALQLSENVNNVRLTIEFLRRAGLIREIEPNQWQLKKLQNMIGGESESAERVRKYREKRVKAGLPDNTRAKKEVTQVLPGNEILLQCNNDVTQQASERKKKVRVPEFEAPDLVEEAPVVGLEKMLKENAQTIGKKADAVPYVRIVELYHSICISYPRIVKIEGTRKKAVAARWRTYGGQQEAMGIFKRLFEKTEASTFLKGGNDKNWSADFDWIMKPSNMAKVLEGKYDNKGGRDNQSELQNGSRYKLTGFTTAE